VFHRGWFQVAVRSVLLSESVHAIAALYGTARLHVNTKAWPELPEMTRFAGVIAEYGPGLEAWAFGLRARCPGLPLLVLLSDLDPALVSRLHGHGIEVAALPLHAPELVAFIQRALVSDFLPHDRVARMVQYLADARGLTPREVQLLSYCLGNEPRARVRRRLGISENTLKTQIRSLLRKCGERNVDALAKNLLRAALLADSPVKRAEPLAPWHPAPRAADPIAPSALRGAA
jgi:DNA-binding NarL/FixJ family response regulator